MIKMKSLIIIMLKQFYIAKTIIKFVINILKDLKKVLVIIMKVDVVIFAIVINLLIKIYKLTMIKKEMNTLLILII